MDTLAPQSIKGSSKFPDPKYSSYIEYFAKKYKVSGLDPNQFLVARIEKNLNQS